MRRTLLRILAGLAVILLWAGTPAVARDQLIIGATQFPSTLHPSIDSMLAKSYVLGLTQRPFTTYDQNWELVCLLCTELPTIENGKAKIEDLAPGFKRDPGTTFCKSADPALATEGMAVTYTIQPNATWGDGTPVTTDDVMFTYEVGKNEKTGFSNSELYRRIVKIDVLDKKTFTIHEDTTASTTSSSFPPISSGPPSATTRPSTTTARSTTPIRPTPACGSDPTA